MNVFLKTKYPHLRLVSTRRSVTYEVQFQSEPYQQTLLAITSPNLLIFVDFDRVTEEGFVELLKTSGTKLIVDLRAVPRFDVGALTRRRALEAFTASGITYLDLSPYLQSSKSLRSIDQAKPLSSALSMALSPILAQAAAPLVLLLDHDHSFDAFLVAVSRDIPSPTNDGWDVAFFPVEPIGRTASTSANDEQGRDLVFISHANPQDNDFVVWLSAQLANAGYRIWADLTSLHGGDTFWTSVDDAIRNHSAKVIVVLSKASQTKDGVLDEINLAVTTERSRRLRRFVIPVRVDDLAYQSIYVSLARKHVIDFSRGWANGLRAVLNVLEEDNVPRTTKTEPNLFTAWLHRATPRRVARNSASEHLITNWLQITELPSALHIYEGARTDPYAWQGTPHFPFGDHVISFLSPDSAAAPASMRHAHKATLLTDEFRAGKSSTVRGLSRNEAHRVLTNLVRQSWDFYLRDRGLRSFGMSTRRTAWFFPSNLVSGDEITYMSLSGQRRRRAVVGKSERRQVFWHYGVEGVIHLSVSPHLTLRQLVLFSTDGQTPLESPERMHVLRRRFCRNWWNDRWRDLLLAFCTWISNGQKTIALLENNHGTLSLASQPVLLTAPVALQADTSEARSGSLYSPYDSFTLHEGDEEALEAAFDEEPD